MVTWYTRGYDKSALDIETENPKTPFLNNIVIKLKLAHIK